MKILITGALGFVGRHFVARLAEEHDLVGVDKRSSVGITAQDYFNEPLLNQSEKFDLVIHLAAMVGGRAKIDGDPLAIAENLAIDSDLFRWAIRTKQPRVVYYSSSAAYPVHLQQRYAEYDLSEPDINLDRPGLPDQTYGWAKLTGEMLAQHAIAAGTKVHIFRPFSGYGEDQSLDYPFPSFINRARYRNNPFVIWGDGTQTRDFIHIDDVVSATLEAVEQDFLEPVNLGTGRATSFNELASLVTTEAGYNPVIYHQIDKPVGCHYRVADVGRMNSFYKAKVSLEEGIRRSFNGEPKTMS